MTRDKKRGNEGKFGKFNRENQPRRTKQFKMMYVILANIVDTNWLFDVPVLFFLIIF